MVYNCHRYPSKSGTSCILGRWKYSRNFQGTDFCIAQKYYIIYIFWTIVLIFVAMFITTFRPLYAPAFFRWLECQTYPFISLTWVDYSCSPSHVYWMSVISYLLLISPLKVLNCFHRVLNSHSFGYITGYNQRLYPLITDNWHPLNMARGTRTVYPGERNKRLSSTFQPPEEGRGVQRPKHWDEHGNKDEGNSPRDVNNIHNTSSQKYSRKCYVGIKNFCRFRIKHLQSYRRGLEGANSFLWLRINPKYSEKKEEFEV